MLTANNGSSRSASLLLAAFASVVYLLTLPNSWVDSAPLPWDCSGHLLGALEVSSALESTDIGGLWRATIQPDLYPPGHSLFVGTWYGLLGSSLAAWWALGLLVYATTVFLVGRVSVAAGAVLLSMPMLGGLATSMMVEPIAAMFLTATIVAASSLFENPTRKRLAAVCVLGAATILTKYNFGIPLMPALVVGGFVTRRRDVIRSSILAAVLIAAAFLGFLMVQEDGIAMFLRFAENRANAAGLSIPARLALYAETLSSRFLSWTPLLVMGLAVAPIALFTRSATVWMCNSYILISMIALARHPYVLSRNLVAVVVVASIAVAYAIAKIERPRVRQAITVGLVGCSLIALVRTSELRAVEAREFYPTGSPGLVELSQTIAHEFELSGRQHVVGTFNEFPSAWVQILAQRQKLAELLVTTGSAQPWGIEREGASTTWHEDYLAITNCWADAQIDRVLAIRLKESSPLHTKDYLLWGKWKANLWTALEQSPRYRMISEQAFEPGIELASFERVLETSDDGAIAFGSGWGRAESWGRWIEGERATLILRREAGRIEYSAALISELGSQQSWRVLVNGQPQKREILQGAPWAWQNFVIVTAGEDQEVAVELQLDHFAQQPSGRRLGLAVANLRATIAAGHSE